jgi:hypothetical protein
LDLRPFGARNDARVGDPPPAASMRRLEVRIGQVLGAPRQGERTDLSTATEKSPLSKDQRSEFRRMAAHPEIVERVIAESDDDRQRSLIGRPMGGML